MSGLQNLVQDGRALTSHILPSSIAPVERGLDQIEAASARLFKRTAASRGANGMDVTMKTDAVDSRTAYLLASRGIDSDRVMQNLVEINLGLSFEPLQGIADTDLESYLRNEHETLVSLAIEETKSKTIADFEDHFEESIQKSWQKEKRRILESMGHHTTLGMDLDEKATPVHSGISGLVSAGGLSNHPRLKAYLGVVKDISDTRLNLERYNVIKAFQKASEKSASEKQQTFVTSCWGLFANMLDIQKENAGKLSAGHFSEDYENMLSDTASESSLRFRHKLVLGGRRWLEDHFRTWMKQHIREQRYEIGGMPSIHNEVDAYLKIKFCRNGRWTLPWLEQSIGNTPFWAHVYILTRMGMRKDALKYIQRHAEALETSKDANFLAYYRAWEQSPDGHLPKGLRDSLLGEWNARIRDYLVNSKSAPKGDAFKYALYKILGRCEINIKTIRNSDVVCTTDDYLWIHNMLISEDSSVSALERYTLRDFSLLMQKFGKAHFKKTDTWFMVLLLCGEFERAVSELSLEPFFAADAIHFAVAMAYYGVLRVPDSPKAIPMSNSLLSITLSKVGNVEYSVYYFHFARLISQFVKDWVKSDTINVFYYLYLIGLYGNAVDAAPPPSVSRKEWARGEDYSLYTYSLIRDIISMTGHTAQLLGEMRADGRGRNPGSIEKYRQLIHLNSEQEFLDRIVLSAAEQADNEARFKDALELYNLAGQPNKVLELLIRQISEKLLSHSVIGGLKQKKADETLFSEDPVESAKKVLDYYTTRQQESSMLSPQTIFTCKTLITLAKFEGLVTQGQVESALDTFYSLNIVSPTNDITIIQNKASEFDSLDESICRVMPSALVQAVSSLSAYYNQIAQSRSAERESRMKDMKERAKAILSFCGSIQYQIPQDMYAQMNRLAVMMG